MALKAAPETPQLPAPAAGSLPEVRSWQRTLTIVLFRIIKDIAFRANRLLPKDGSEPMMGPLTLTTIAAAELPAAADYEGAIVYVPDGGAGAVFRGSNGSAWVNLG